MSTKKQQIPVSAPVLQGNEQRYVMDCLESTWISSTGKYIQQFESAFANFCNVKHAVSCSNGTTALHLALMALGVGPGDEVIVPTLTFVATANAVKYCGANAVFVDAEPNTWNIDPKQIESKITPRTKGIIVVHLFGHPVDMDPILFLAHRRNLFVMEDAAQAHGAEYKGRRVGSLGDVATFSFFGNKIVSTGEGGMVVTDNTNIADQINLLKNHGMDPCRRYWHPVVGYNYRMTNIAAAIGLAQLEKVEWQLQRRQEVRSWYREVLGNVRGLEFQSEMQWAKHVWWMFSVIIAGTYSVTVDEVMTRMQARGIETRPIVFPIHQLPPYLKSVLGEKFPVADRIARFGINLPTWAGLTRDDIGHICSQFLEILQRTNSLQIPLRA